MWYLAPRVINTARLGVWRSRFLEALPHLWEVQESAPDKLSDEVREIFSDRPRPGCPCVFTQEQKIRYWLHSPEKSENPETFAAKVNEICSLYLGSTDLMEENTCVVSTDEMTGVQALEHKYPHKLPLPGQGKKLGLCL